ncbi:hypothetical protein GGF50DRAFT_121930 [Schizophyllum commune]
MLYKSMRYIVASDGQASDRMLGKRVKNVEQADNGNLSTHLVPPLQERLTESIHYAESKDLHTNVAKTAAVAFDHRWGPLIPLRIYDKDFCWKAEAMSAGVPFCQHAPSAVGLEGTCHLRRHTRPHQLLWGPVPSAGSDPILCFGCEIGPAVDPATLHGARAGACAAELPAKDIGTLQESSLVDFVRVTEKSDVDSITCQVEEPFRAHVR